MTSIVLVRGNPQTNFHAIKRIGKKGAAASSKRNQEGRRSEQRPYRPQTASLIVTYDVLGFGAGSQSLAKVAKHFPDNYGLPKKDLAWLLNEWRRQALVSAANHRS